MSYDEATVFRQECAILRQQLEQRTQELAKWQQPFNPVQFQMVKEQASHGDSLVAQRVYITALEHALKNHAQQLTEVQAKITRMEMELNECPRTSLLRAVDEIQKAFIKSPGDVTMSRIVEAIVEFLHEEADRQTSIERTPT